MMMCNMSKYTKNLLDSVFRKVTFGQFLPQIFLFRIKVSSADSLPPSKQNPKPEHLLSLLTKG